MDYEEYLFVPKERIGVLIGEKGRTRQAIEKKTGVKIEIDSETGEVNLERSEKTDALKALQAREVIKAIARGFSPERALKLLQDDYYLKVIDLEEYIGSERALARQKARLIGTDGKARRFLEKTTNTEISVYGKSVAIIGDLKEVELAAEAITRLVSGSPHGKVYKFIGKKREKW
ncbi:KH domain-containing protein [archaeon]|nr:KH domain-containing protein [archaeon]